MRAHALSQHAVQPKYRCPLCQEQLVGRPALHFHLSHLHNVVPECVEKLLLVVSTGCGRTRPEALAGPGRRGARGRAMCKCVHWGRKQHLTNVKVDFRVGGNLRVELILLPCLPGRKLSISLTSIKF